MLRLHCYPNSPIVLSSAVSVFILPRVTIIVVVVVIHANGQAKEPALGGCQRRARLLWMHSMLPPVDAL